MVETIKSKNDLCTGCNRCVRECPLEMANITWVDEYGSIKVKVDNEKCIACGRCVSACKHKARYYADDTERFFDDLARGIPITLMAAPSVCTNIPNYKRLFTYLKQIGLKRIIDVSLGADICIWAHIRLMEKGDYTHLITQPCPSIVLYCEIYRHDLLKYLSPVHSPMACASVYIKKYLGVTDRIAAISPCIAKSNEFYETRLAKYNITFTKLLEYLEKNNIELPDEETQFDHAESGLGSLFPLPGGLKENVEYFTGGNLHVGKAEGFSVYGKLDKYLDTPKELLPDIFDVLNCIEGCNAGPACTNDRNQYLIDKTMFEVRKRVKDKPKKEHYEAVYKEFDEKFELEDFLREYRKIKTVFPHITEEDIEKAFLLLNKTDYDKQNVDCGACGSETCRDMARRIALNVNIPISCIVKSMELIHETENQRKAADNANRAKTTFLSTMSHEIRTPMNAILGITEIQLQDETMSQGVREALEKIHASGDLLLGIINDILDMSKIEAGRLELYIEKYEIASMISDTAQLNMMRIGNKFIEFEISVDEDMPANLMGDELRVKQILNNLLSNAFKYTTSGTVKLEATAEASETNSDEVILVFSVSDTGQGMTKEQIDKLFEEYARFNQESNRATEGTGLGMSITRNLISLMNGEIIVDSEPGQGSVFTVRLPQEKCGPEILGLEMAKNLRLFRTRSRAQMKRVQITRDPMPYGSVLIVDDVETNIYVARGLLTPYELTIDAAESGFTAIEKIKNDLTYDIIFMDHMMPRMDGIEATRILRDMGYTRPIVALTANAVVGQSNIFLQSGFDDFISKPIDIRQLNQVLNRLIRDKYPPDVVNEARRLANIRKGIETEEPEEPFVLERLTAEAFTRDAKKALNFLENLMRKGDGISESELRTYTIHVHGMKSALANVGKTEPSAVAKKLEKLGRSGDIEAINNLTPAFISSLFEVLEEIAPKDRNAGGETADDSEENKKWLYEKLLVIKAACHEYDESSVENALNDLKNQVWSRPVEDILRIISELLLHSDFDEIVNVLERFESGS